MTQAIVTGLVVVFVCIASVFTLRQLQRAFFYPSAAQHASGR
jgi:hypothetical protein